MPTHDGGSPADTPRVILPDAKQSNDLARRLVARDKALEAPVLSLRQCYGATATAALVARLTSIKGKPPRKPADVTEAEIEGARKLPIKPRGLPLKAPIESPDWTAKTIAALKGRKPSGLWGVVPSTITVGDGLGLAVVDADAKDELTLNRILEAVNEHLAPPLLVHSTSNAEAHPYKRHIWVAVRRGEAPSNAAFGAGELRGRGGYVCLWRPDEVAGLLDLVEAQTPEPVPAEAWADFLGALRPPKPDTGEKPNARKGHPRKQADCGRKCLEAAVAKLRAAPEGSRHQTFYDAVNSLARRAHFDCAVPEGETRAALVGAYVDMTGRTAEGERSFSDAWKDGTKQPDDFQEHAGTFHSREARREARKAERKAEAERAKKHGAMFYLAGTDGYFASRAPREALRADYVTTVITKTFPQHDDHGNLRSGEAHRQFGIETGLIEAVERVSYTPGASYGMQDDGSFNAWRDGGIGPRDGGAPEFEEHLAWLIPDVLERRILIAWLARLVQHPGQRIGWAPVLLGPTEGSGKNLLFAPIRLILGEENVDTPRAVDFVDKHWTGAGRKTLVLVSEIDRQQGRKFGRKDVYETAKELITEPHVDVNPKHQPFRKEPVTANLALISNKVDAVALPGRTARRMAFISCTDRKMKAHLGAGETARRAQALNNPEVAARVYGWLMAQDVAALDQEVGAMHGEAPESATRAEVHDDSKSNLAAYLQEFLWGCPAQAVVVGLSQGEPVYQHPTLPDVLQHKGLNTAPEHREPGDRCQWVSAPEVLAALTKDGPRIHPAGVTGRVNVKAVGQALAELCGWEGRPARSRVGGALGHWYDLDAARHLADPERCHLAWYGPDGCSHCSHSPFSGVNGRNSTETKEKDSTVHAVHTENEFSTRRKKEYTPNADSGINERCIFCASIGRKVCNGCEHPDPLAEPIDKSSRKGVHTPSGNGCEHPPETPSEHRHAAPKGGRSPDGVIHCREAGCEAVYDAASRKWVEPEPKEA